MKYKITTNSGKQYMVTVRDMALSRTDAMDRCIDLGQGFIEHFDKIYKNPKDSSVPHWMTEMRGWYEKVKRIKLKQNNSPLTNTQLHDWFFTAGAIVQDFMDNPTTAEINCYAKFEKQLLAGQTIQGAWEAVYNAI